MQRVRMGLGLVTGDLAGLDVRAGGRMALG